MQRWDKNKGKISQEEKLKLILSIANGNFDFDELNRVPLAYQVFVISNYDESDITYDISCTQTGTRLQFKSKKAYEEWHSKLRDCDRVFKVVFKEQRTETEESDVTQLQANYGHEVIEQPKQQAEERRAVKPKKKAPVKEIEVLKINDNYFPLQPLPNSGKISEYGQTWKLRNN